MDNMQVKPGLAAGRNRDVMRALSFAGATPAVPARVPKPAPKAPDADETILTRRRAAVAKEVTVTAAAAPTVSVLRELQRGGANVKRARIRPPRVGVVAGGRVGKEGAGVSAEPTVSVLRELRRGGANVKRARIRPPRAGVVAGGRVGKEGADGSAVRGLARKLADAIRRADAETARREAAEKEVKRFREALVDMEDELLEERHAKVYMQARNDEKLAQLEVNVRKKVSEEAKKVIDDLQETHQREMEELRSQVSAEKRKCYEVAKTSRKKMVQAIAGRASMAFSNFRYDLYSDEEEEEAAGESEDSSSVEEDEDDDEDDDAESAEEDASNEDVPSENTD